MMAMTVRDLWPPLKGFGLTQSTRYAYARMKTGVKSPSESRVVVILVMVPGPVDPNECPRISRW
nr:MAG TPA: hypothetical protein [Caudoviricetes sp.]